MRIVSLTVALALAAGGCALKPPSRPEPEYRPAYPEMPPAAPVSSGSLYRAGYGLLLFEDARASRVGDVITIRLEERTVSSKSAETSITKDASTEMEEPLIFGSLIRGVAENAGIATRLESETEFNGTGESDQSNSLFGTVTVVVAAVLPNGLLQVQGEKWLKLNRGEEYIRISGLLRPEDIDDRNSVSSLRLADARIAYSGTGALTASNTPGWLTRFFISPLNPF